MKYFIGFTCFALLSSFGIWLSGYDFNERGIDALLSYIFIMSSGYFGACAASLYKRKE